MQFWGGPCSLHSGTRSGAPAWTPLIGATFAHACVCLWVAGWVISLKHVNSVGLVWFGLGWVYGGSRRLVSVLHDVCFPLDLDLCRRFPLHFVKDPCECGWVGGLLCLCQAHSVGLPGGHWFRRTLCRLVCVPCYTMCAGFVWIIICVLASPFRVLSDSFLPSLASILRICLVSSVACAFVGRLFALFSL